MNRQTRTRNADRLVRRGTVLLVVLLSLAARLSAQVDVTLFSDANGNCAFDTMEQRLRHVIVELDGPAGTFYAVTDTFGQASFDNVPPGTYAIATGLTGAFWQPCPVGSVSLTIANPTASVALGMTPQVQCTDLHVELAGDVLEPCDTVTYGIRYANLGTITGDDMTVLLQLPEGLVYQSSSIPAAIPPGSDSLLFYLSALPVTHSDFFTVTALVSCSLDTVLTHCARARIFPEPDCFPATGWDQAHLDVESGCVGDSTFFLIRNTGAGGMGTAQPFIIAEDEIMYRQGWFQLPPGGDTLLIDPATGPTRVLLTRQSNGHPGLDRPITWVEGCNGAVTPGMVNRYPQNEADAGVAVQCLEGGNVPAGSTQTGYPVGLGPEHYIPREQALDYLIRFVNTGAAAATQLTVRDELPPELDPLSVRPGAGSRPYAFDVTRNALGANEVRFTMSGPFSPGEQGFVQFTAAQRPALPDGTLLENNVEVQFVGQPPVALTPVFHTIEEVNWLALLGASPFNPLARGLQVRISPNPVREQAIISVPGWEWRSLRLTLFDLQGRRLGSDVVGDGFVVLDRGALPAGVYAFRLTADDGQLVSGKLVVR